MAKLLEKDKRNNLICAVVFLMGAWLVAWLRLRNIDIMKGPYIFPDQLGYFTHAAVFNGLFWYQTTDTWYSYGVSIVLAMIMKITHNMASIYKIAIYINVLLSEFGYLLGCIFVQQINSKIRKELGFAISAIASCCTAYVFQAQVVWAETYVYTVFMLVLVLAAWYAKKPNVFRVIILSICVCLLFVIHNRTIVVVPALLGFVFFTMFADKKVIRRCLHLVIIFAMFLGTYKVNSTVKYWLLDREGITAQVTDSEKEWIEANSVVVAKTATTRDIRPIMDGYDWSGEYDSAFIHDFPQENNNENNLTGRLFNFALVFNDTNALWGMLKSFGGCLWYLLASTLGMAAFGLIYIIKAIFAGLKRGTSPEDKLMTCFWVFVLLCVGATMAETGYNAMWYPEYTYSTEGTVRWEMLFYGRYVEFLTMPLIILGLIDILEKIDKKKMLVEGVCAFAVQIFAAVLVCYESMQISDSTLNLVCVPGIAGLLDKGIVVACFGPIVLSILIYIIIKISLRKYGVLQGVVALIILGFFYINLKPIEAYNNEAQIALNGYDELAAVLHNNTDVQVIIDSSSVLSDRYYRVRTQAIDNTISYYANDYWQHEGDMIFITSEDNVDSFVSEHPEDELKVLDYGNYPMIIKGSDLAARLIAEGYELK